jgi:hypothetical protein
MGEESDEIGKSPDQSIKNAFFFFRFSSSGKRKRDRSLALRQLENGSPRLLGQALTGSYRHQQRPE